MFRLRLIIAHVMKKYRMPHSPAYKEAMGRGSAGAILVISFCVGPDGIFAKYSVREDTKRGKLSKRQIRAGREN